MIESEMSIDCSHELIHLIEERIRNELNQNVQLIAHLEPFIDGRVRV